MRYYWKKAKGLRRKKKCPKMRKKRQKSLMGHKKDAWREFSRYIRLRDCFDNTEHAFCFTCRKPYHYKDMQAGHYIHDLNSTYFNPMNVHAQCVRCNYFLNGNGKVYRKHMVDTYGRKAVDKLERSAKAGKKFTKGELIRLKKRYKRLIPKLKDRYYGRTTQIGFD